MTGTGTTRIVKTLDAQHAIDIVDTFVDGKDIMLHAGDALDFCKTVPDDAVQLVVTSPPYGIGKSYESGTVDIGTYIAGMEPVARELARVLSPSGSLCWQVGNHVENGEIVPLDIPFYSLFTKFGLHMRNRIFWHFRHGLHAKYRFSGRHETISWFTKSPDIHGYTFNLDSIRVPQVEPGKKKFKGPDAGKLSCNPAGKNPSDVWEFMELEWEEGIIDAPNVKSNHCEKVDHPCQFPVEIPERLVLALANPGDIVLDPFAGTCTTAIAAIKHGRRTIAVDKERKYIDIGADRIEKFLAGSLETRPIGTTIYKQKWLRAAEQAASRERDRKSSKLDEFF